MPWRLLSSPSGFIFSWLGGYGDGMGAIAGVMIADYWIVRRGKRNVRELFSAHGAYRYTRAWNIRALVATGVGLLLAWGGYVIPGMEALTDYGWFAGFFAAAIAHCALSVAFPARSGVARRHRLQEEPA